MRDWHRGKILILWTVTVALGIAAIVNRSYDDPLERIALVALAISAVLSWVWLSARETRTNVTRENEGVPSSREHLVKVTVLAMRAGVPPAQAKSHYETLRAAFGQRAIDYVAQLLERKEYERVFGDRDLVSALDQLSKSPPDPELEALLPEEFKRERERLRRNQP